MEDECLRTVNDDKSGDSVGMNEPMLEDNNNNNIVNNNNNGVIYDDKIYNGVNERGRRKIWLELFIYLFIIGIISL